MKKPLSLRLLYLLSKISYWGLIVVTAIVVFAGIIMLTLDPQLMKLGFSSDLTQITEVVYLNTSAGTPVEVELVTDGIEVPVKHLDRPTMLYVLSTALAWLVCITFVVRYFKLFIKKALGGQTFHSESILLLQKAALGLIVLEAIDLTAAITGHFYVKDHFDLGGLAHTFSYPFPSTALLVSLTLWALVHIFKKGKELDDEQKLTI